MPRTATGPRASRLGAIVLALLAVVSLVACGDGDDEDAQDDTSSTTANTTANDAETDGGGDGGSDGDVTVEVLENGAEPRTPLRFEFTEGAPFRVEMVMKVGIEIEIDGQVLPSTAVPATRVVMAGKIDRVEDDTAEYSFRYEDVTVEPDAGIDPQVVQAMEGAFAAVDGVSGTAAVTTRGATSRAEVDTSTIADPTAKSTLDSLTSQMSSLTVPFPAEAVGVGARWRGTSAVTLNGVETRATTTYTLAQREGNTFRVELDQDVSASSGEVDVPEMPAGASAEIVSYDVANNGFVAGTLDSVMPTSSELRGGGDIQMRIRQGQETNEMKQRLTLELRTATI